jgi:hypothetical protein
MIGAVKKAKLTVTPSGFAHYKETYCIFSLIILWLLPLLQVFSIVNIVIELVLVGMKENYANFLINYRTWFSEFAYYWGICHDLILISIFHLQIFEWLSMINLILYQKGKRVE